MADDQEEQNREALDRYGYDARSTVPIEATPPDQNQLSEGEYRDWIKPSAALKALTAHLNNTEAVDTLIQHLRSGMLAAVAETLVIILRDEKRTEASYVILHHMFWREHYGTNYISGLWQSGSVSHELDGDMIAAHGIKFDPAKLGRILAYYQPDEVESVGVSDPISLEPRKTRHGFSALPDSRLAEWHALFLKVYPNGSKALAEKSVFGMFPDHSIDREKVRELFPDKARGRPPKSNG